MEKCFTLGVRKGLVWQVGGMHSNQITKLPPSINFQSRTNASGKFHIQAINGNSNNYGSDEMDGETFMAGVLEAQEIYLEAQRAALDATKAELMDALMTDMGEDGGFFGRLGSSVPTVQSTEGFLLEAGASTHQASELARRLISTGSPYSNSALLLPKIERLKRLLPNTNIFSLIMTDIEMLDIDLYKAVENLVCISTHLPGVNVEAMVTTKPTLLACPNLKQKIENVLGKLQSLLPKWSMPMFASVLEENPGLVFRMELYMDKQFSELPMEIQNMMAIGGGGGGYLYKSWSGFIDNNTD